MIPDAAMRAGLLELIEQPVFVDRYPFYAAVLAQMHPVDDATVDVMAVSGHQEGLRLHVNSEYFASHPEHVHGVLLHEVHHVVLGHLSEPKFRDPAYPDLMRLAMEMSANEHIKEPLPDNIVTWKDFARHGVRAGQSTMERYNRLAERRNEGALVHLPLRLCGVGVVLGSCIPKEIFDDVPGTDQDGRERRRRAKPEIVGRVLREAARTTMRSQRRVFGTVAGELIEKLTRVSEPPRVWIDWRDALRNLVDQVRAPRHSYQRPSRRFPERVGELPGRKWLPDELDRPRLLVAVDTSGSMITDELEEVGRQLRALGNLARITVAECDVEIQRVYRFEGKLESVTGRGGTDLRPVFEADFLAKHRPSAVVYFTDGYGPYPDHNPGVRTLWVLTHMATHGAGPFGCSWGEQVPLRVPAA